MYCIAYRKQAKQRQQPTNTPNDQNKLPAKYTSKETHPIGDPDLATQRATLEDVVEHPTGDAEITHYILSTQGRNPPTNEEAR